MTPFSTQTTNAAAEDFQWTDWIWAVLVCVLFLLPGLSYGEVSRIAYPIQMVTGAVQPHPSTVQIHGRTLFPNTCFTTEMNGGRYVDRETIELAQYVLYSDGHCPERMTPAGVVISFERPNDGVYMVQDAFDDRFLGVLELNEGVAHLFPKEEL